MVLPVGAAVTVNDVRLCELIPWTQEHATARKHERAGSADNTATKLPLAEARTGVLRVVYKYTRKSVEHPGVAKAELLVVVVGRGRRRRTR